MAMTFYGCKHNQNPIILKEDDVKEIKINIDTIEYYK